MRRLLLALAFVLGGSLRGRGADLPCAAEPVLGGRAGLDRWHRQLFRLTRQRKPAVLNGQGRGERWICDGARCRLLPSTARSACAAGTAATRPLRDVVRPGGDQRVRVPGVALAPLVHDRGPGRLSAQQAARPLPPPTPLSYSGRPCDAESSLLPRWRCAPWRLLPGRRTRSLRRARSCRTRR